MGLLIQDKLADYSNNPSAKKFYLDTIISNGSLLCLDFSRQSTIPNNTLKDGDVVNSLVGNLTTTFNVTSNANKTRDFIINGSYEMKNTSLTNGENTAINLGQSIQQYLNTRNVKRAVIIIWVYNPVSQFNGFGAISSTTSESIGNGHIIRMLSNITGTITLSIAGTVLPAYNISSDNKFHQIAVYYNQGQPLTLYDNTEAKHISTTPAGLWGLPNSNLIIGQNTGADGNLSTTRIGRFIIEDLELSGRTALDVIREDYDYVNARGNYFGIEKRPYANL